jgi:hypothetical protein
MLHSSPSGLAIPDILQARDEVRLFTFQPFGPAMFPVNCVCMASNMLIQVVAHSRCFCAQVGEYSEYALFQGKKPISLLTTE